MFCVAWEVLLPVPMLFEKRVKTSREEGFTIGFLYTEHHRMWASGSDAKRLQTVRKWLFSTKYIPTRFGRRNEPPKSVFGNV